MVRMPRFGFGRPITNTASQVAAARSPTAPAAHISVHFVAAATLPGLEAISTHSPFRHPLGPGSAPSRKVLIARATVRGLSEMCDKF